VYRPDDLVIEPTVLEVFMRNLNDLVDEMRAAGAFVFSGGLDDAHVANVVQIQGAEVATTDGPFAEDKWHLSGFMIVEAADMDSALEWGRKLARLSQTAKLPVEVRPIRFEVESR